MFTVFARLRLVTAMAGLLCAPFALAQDLGQRQIFDREVCTQDGLSPAECECAWTFLNGKMSGRDLRIGLLLLASDSEDQDVGRAADQQLDKLNPSDRKRDTISQEIGALVIEAQDACIEE